MGIHIYISNSKHVLHPHWLELKIPWLGSGIDAGLDRAKRKRKRYVVDCTYLDQREMEHIKTLEIR